jgi:uncharacterized protein YndB with AHSA1/START domain
MIWLYIAIAVVVGIPLLLAAVGMFLPRGHVNTRSARFARSPQAVWDVITDFAGATTWRTGLARVEMLPPVGGKASFVEHGKDGKLPFVVEEQVAPRRLVMRILDKGLAFGGCWILEVAADGDGARLTITEDGFIRNPIFRTLSRTVFSTSATIEQYLRGLGAHFGETVTPAAAERLHAAGSAG